MTAQQLATFRTAALRRLLQDIAIRNYNRAIANGRPQRDTDALDVLVVRAQRNADAALNACYAAFGINPGLAGGRRHNDARLRVWCAVSRVAATWMW